MFFTKRCSHLQLASPNILTPISFALLCALLVSKVSASPLQKEEFLLHLTYCPTGASLTTSHGTLITPPFLASASWNVLPDASEGWGSSLHFSILSSVTSTTQRRLSVGLFPGGAWKIFPRPTSFPSPSTSDTSRPGSNEKDLVNGRLSIMFWENSAGDVSSLLSGLTSLPLAIAFITLAGGR